jgi:hypothetical protein
MGVSLLPFERIVMPGQEALAKEEEESEEKHTTRS